MRNKNSNADDNATFSRRNMLLGGTTFAAVSALASAAPMRTAPMATVVSRSASPAAASAAIMSAGSATTSASASPRIAARWMLWP